jgi:hypothetical protein
MFSFLAMRLDSMRFGSSQFDALAHLTALRSWMVMKCQQVWPNPSPAFAQNMNCLVSFCEEYQDFARCQLMHPPHWDDLLGRNLSIAVVLDCISDMSRVNRCPCSCQNIMMNLKPHGLIHVRRLMSQCLFLLWRLNAA